MIIPLYSPPTPEQREIGLAKCAELKKMLQGAKRKSEQEAEQTQYFDDRLQRISRLGA